MLSRRKTDPDTKSYRSSFNIGPRGFLIKVAIRLLLLTLSEVRFLGQLAESVPSLQEIQISGSGLANGGHLSPINGIASSCLPLWTCRGSCKCHPYSRS